MWVNLIQFKIPFNFFLKQIEINLAGSNGYPISLYMLFNLCFFRQTEVFFSHFDRISPWHLFSPKTVSNIWKVQTVYKFGNVWHFPEDFPLWRGIYPNVVSEFTPRVFLRHYFHFRHPRALLCDQIRQSIYWRLSNFQGVPKGFGIFHGSDCVLRQI